MDTAKDPFLGRKIRGYRLEELCHRGNMTTTYRARTRELWLVPELLITIFQLPHTLPGTMRRNFHVRFERESEQLVTLRHAHLFPLYGYGVEEGIFYHIRPMFSGEMLASRLKEQRRWSPYEVLTILNPIADLLDFIHEQGRAYYYLNSSNVLLLDKADVKLIDLGTIAMLRLRGLEESATQATMYEHLKNVAGNYLSPPEYLAPEIVRGAEGDPRSDVYSLGIMLFELLSGAPPFTGSSYLEVARKHINEPLPSLHEIAPAIPVALELVVNHALHRDPERRFQTVRELVTAYTHVLNERLNAPKQVSIAQRIEKIREMAGPAIPPPMPLPAPQQQSEKVEPVSQLLPHVTSDPDETFLLAWKSEPQ
ncbi:hypothetical protein KSC_009160 [Ktedonobacter sp. SOSP1-52]|uniref:serine/threonine protein kinase n=1 Tax=Ktedonobacter sp. SOSP1-52 TaxID=2778366 RepID=UPI001915EB8F|nr:serine/threonine-protein kinase [Ktedonobacter sp. SOSP1-52]GHO62024.1 hypothetical protein KSC_009160 [Ktedonobacter sp. SOSP1-52]